MVPVLFSSNETAFTTQGLGRLPEAFDVTVKWELNATYEMNCKYPASGRHIDNIKIGRMTWCEPYPGGKPQAFRIYEIDKDTGESITINCEHISYGLNNIPISPYQAKTANAALAGIKQQSLCDNPFTFKTNLSVSGSFSLEAPTMARTVLCGGENSIQAAFGGELLFDNYSVYLMNAIGSDSGAILRYGKNITDLKQEENIQDTVSGIVPYYKTKDGNIIYLPEKVLHSDNTSNFPYTKIGLLDCADMAGDSEDYTPSTAGLRNYAKQWMIDNNVGVPAVSISVSYVDLKKEGLTAVHPGDSVGVVFAELGVNKKAEVVGYEYDVIAERYTSVTVGEPFPDLAVTLINQQKSTLSSAATLATSQAELAAEGGCIILKQVQKNRKQGTYYFRNDRRTIIYHVGTRRAVRTGFRQVHKRKHCNIRDQCRHGHNDGCERYFLCLECVEYTFRGECNRKCTDSLYSAVFWRLKMQTIQLNLTPCGVPPTIYASMYDVGRIFEFEIYEDAASLSIPTNATVVMRGMKPDHHAFVYSTKDDTPNVSFSGNVVTVTSTEQMTAAVA